MQRPQFKTLAAAWNAGGACGAPAVALMLAACASAPTPTASKATPQAAPTDSGPVDTGAASAASALLATPWPGETTVEPVDAEGRFPSNLSGLHLAPSAEDGAAVLWAVVNEPAALHRLLWNGTQWAAPAGTWEHGQPLRYPDGQGDPDAEGVTRGDWDSPGVYVVAERNNTVPDESRLSILRFDENQAGDSMSAVQEWNLTDLLPAVPANIGLEAITWVPDSHLVAGKLEDELTGAMYDPSRYPHHGTGLFVVGMEASGDLFVLALNHEDSKASLVATVQSGFPAVMSLEFDRAQQRLWAVCDDTCGNELALLEINKQGHWTPVVRYSPPAALPRSNYEGFALGTASQCLDGQRPVLWSDDSAKDHHALRLGYIKACPSAP